MLVGLMAMAALRRNGLCWRVGDFTSPSSNPGNSGAFVGRSLESLLAVGPAITGALACGGSLRRTFPARRARRKRKRQPRADPDGAGALAICCVLGGLSRAVAAADDGTAVPLPLETAHTTVSCR